MYAIRNRAPEDKFGAGAFGWRRRHEPLHDAAPAIRCEQGLTAPGQQTDSAVGPDWAHLPRRDPVLCQRRGRVPAVCRTVLYSERWYKNNGRSGKKRQVRGVQPKLGDLERLKRVDDKYQQKGKRSIPRKSSILFSIVAKPQSAGSFIMLNK